MSEQNPREIAAQILRGRETGAGYVELLLEKTLSATRLSAVDRALCQELVYGVVRWQSTLDWLIARKTTGRTQKVPLQVLLRLGLYQVFWLDRIPDHAAVNETVAQARRAGFGPQSGFLNAILRGYIREADATRGLLSDLKSSQPHLGYSHPEWLVDRWQRRWGPEKTGKLLAWNNTPPQTFARINSLVFQGATAAETRSDRPVRPFMERPIKDAGDVLEQWRNEGVDYNFVRRDWFEENLLFEFKSHPPIAKLRSFQQGLFYVQDPSTLLAVRELDPRPGERILDFCAAPGGKSTYIAQVMGNQGQVVAHDPVPDRLKLVEENCHRLGVGCVQTATPESLGARAQGFDRILIDAPCSNTGVMRRRVDLRWRIRPEEIGRLAATQLDLLGQAAARLRPGGLMVYSTCSLEPEENAGVIEAFLAQQPEFELDRTRELVPLQDGVDGAYVARLRKKGGGS